MATVEGIEELEAQLNAAAAAAAKKAAEVTVKQAEEKMRTVADTAIDRWYSDYSPLYYAGRGALKNYSITDDGSALYVDFEQQIADHQDNDLVLEIVVACGFHGGSPGAGTSGIRWRTPVPQSSAWPRQSKGNGDYSVRGYRYWGRYAEHSQAIINEINDNIKDINANLGTRAEQIFYNEFYASL